MVEEVDVIGIGQWVRCFWRVYYACYCSTHCPCLLVKLWVSRDHHFAKLGRVYPADVF